MMKDYADLEKFIDTARQLGATNAKVIAATSVVTAAWVRMKCQFGCAGYSTNHYCPPRTPTPQQTREVIDCYRRALLIHCTGDARPKKIVVKLEREIFLSGFYKALAFGAGPCTLCKECNPSVCIHPDQTRPSMESCGIDVYATVRANGFPIEVLTDRSCIGNYYGLILID